MAETGEKAETLTPKQKLERNIEKDSFYLKMKGDYSSEQILYYKYGYVTAGLSGELMRMNETLKNIKSQLIDGGMAEDSVLINAIKNRNTIKRY